MKKWLLAMMVAAVVLGACRPIQAPATTGGTGASTATSTAAPAAPADLQAKLPTDPDVRIGKLENGLTYYVRANHEPKQRAELWLAVNAGSVLESNDQQGLAHFLEHMMFNGTQRYPGPALVNFLEKLGIQFGPDLNAYTSFDETVYQLQVPTDQTEILSTALDVLKEWASAATLDPKEIDAERGVIVEEWRLREQNASGRIREKLIPMLLAGSQYAKRLPIGDMDIVRNAKPEAFSRFYQEWYRPDLMAVVAVGDFDPASVEAQIKDLFGGLKNPVQPVARPTVEVPQTQGDHYLVITDPETPYATLRIMHRIASRPVNTTGDLRDSLTDDLVSQMLGTRLSDITQQPGSPLLGAYADRSELVRNADMYAVLAQTPEDKLLEGLKTLVTETERARRYGFTATELERAKTNLLRQYEQMSDKRDTLNSSYFVQTYTDHFLNGGALPSVDEQYTLAKELLPTITLDMVNQRTAALMPEKDRAVIATAPKKAGLVVPTEAQLAETITATVAADIQPYVDTALERPLVAEPPAPAAIVSQRTLTDTGATEIELANGIHVIMKPTDFDRTQVLFHSFSPGGMSLRADAEYPAVSTATDIAQYSGVADLTLTQLQKLLTGKAVNVSPYIGELEEGFTGSADTKDIETALQLIYLYATQPRFDEQGLDVYKDQMLAFLKNRSLNPDSAVTDALAKALCGDSIRCNYLPVDKVDALTLQQAQAMYQDRFADLGDSTFVFVGAFDQAKLTDLVQRYLGALPGHGRKEQWKDAITEPPLAPVTEDIYKGEGDRSSVTLAYHGPFELSLQNEVTLSALEHLLDIRLREVIREKLGGSYSPYAQASWEDRPDPKYKMSMGFTADPKRADELIKATQAMVADLRANPTSEDNVTKVKEQLLRHHELDLRDNGYWLNILSRAVDEPSRITDPTEYAAAVNNLTAASLQEALNHYLNQDALVEVVQYPEGFKP